MEVGAAIFGRGQNSPSKRGWVEDQPQRIATFGAAAVGAPSPRTQPYLRVPTGSSSLRMIRESLELSIKMAIKKMLTLSVSCSINDYITISESNKDAQCPALIKQGKR